MTRWLAPLVLAAALVACTAPDSTTPEPTPPPTTATPSPTPPPPTVLTPEPTLPDEPVTVLGQVDPVALAAGAAATFFASSPVVVVAPAGDAAAQLEAAALAVAAGVPLLVATPVPQGVPAPAEPAATIAALGADVVLVVGTGLDARAVGHALTPVEDAAELIGARPASLDGADPVAAVAALERPTLGPRAGSVLGEDLLGEARAPVGGLVLTTGDRAATAAVASARAAGVAVLIGPPDPRATSESVQSVAAAAAERTVALGPEFGAPDALAGRLAMAASGAELPTGGQLLFAGTSYVALYGSPGVPALGVLGEQPLAEAIVRAREHAEPYQAMTDDVVVPALEIIASIASAGAGEDGTYSWKIDPESLLPWVEAAQEEGVYVILDLQPGRQDFLTQARLYEDLLVYPNVGLALDPEWRLAPDQVHLRQIGSVGIAEVNEVAAYLAGLVQAHGLPQKMLVLHQFTTRMIPDREGIEFHDELAVVVHVDGQGSQGAKQGTWAAIRAGAPDWFHWGWKNFYDEDVPMLDPTGTYQVAPRPDLVTYQ